jgi:hypothetical protein
MDRAFQRSRSLMLCGTFYSVPPNYLNDDNKLYIFLLGGSKSLHSYEPLKNIGAKIYNANNANEFCDMVLTDME